MKNSQQDSNPLRTLGQKIDLLYQVVERLAAAQQARPSAPPDRPRDSLQPRVSPDHRSVTWRIDGVERTFELTVTESACFAILLRCWQSGCPVVGQAYVLDAAGSEAKRLRSVFKRTINGVTVKNPILDTLIVAGKGQGVYRLVDPS